MRQDSGCIQIKGTIGPVAIAKVLVGNLTLLCDLELTVDGARRMQHNSLELERTGVDVVVSGTILAVEVHTLNGVLCCQPCHPYLGLMLQLAGGLLIERYSFPEVLLGTVEIS